MQVLDANGYAKSILPTKEGKCYVCNNETETVRHEVFYGTANRVNSKYYGTWVNVCPRCHAILHADPNRGRDADLKKNAQWLFERSHSRVDFIRIYGRSWL